MNIIIDTREKQPWQFANAIIQKLDTGDYTLQGYEDVLCIERKKSVSELAKNIVQNRFANELERMSMYLYPFLLLEFSQKDVHNYPQNANIPLKLKKKIRVKGAFIMSRLKHIMLDYGICVCFCDNVEYAQSIAYDIMEKVNNKEGLKYMKMWRNLWIDKK